MPNDKKYTIIQQLIIIGLLAILMWDIFLNKNIFNAYHLGLSIFIIITVFDKFKFDSLRIKIPGLLEIAESNKKINKNIEKIANKIQIDASAVANASAKANSSFALNAASVTIKMPDGKEIDPKKIEDSETSLR